jgi:tryptophan halogenase
MPVFDPNRAEKMEFRQVKIRNGYHKRSWVKNVCAIGLSSGFLEPLESTGLLFTHQILLYLVRYLQRPEPTQWDRDSFNLRAEATYKDGVMFVTMHYALSQRKDSPYWSSLTEKSYSIDLHEYIGNFTERNQAAIFSSMGYTEYSEADLIGNDFVKRVNYKKEFSPYIELRKQRIQNWNVVIDSAPTHFEYLKENIYYDFE